MNRWIAAFAIIACSTSVASAGDYYGYGYRGDYGPYVTSVYESPPGQVRELLDNLI